MGKIVFRGYCLIGCGNPVFSGSAKAKYCSSACAKLRFERNRGNCLRCGDKLKRKQYKYCSLSCAGSQTRKPRPNCAVCGKTVSLAKQKYCSQKCHRQYQSDRRRQLLENGLYCGIYNCNGYIKKYLIGTFGERCSECGWNKRHPLTGKVPVEVEHIDGNWQNNHIENLKLLCPNCHSLTATFHALNRGRGRAKRLGGRENPFLSDGFKDSGAD